MKKKVIITLIALISISLSGIIAVQLLWMENAIEIKETEFNRQVIDALNVVVERLEKQSTAFLLIDKMKKDSTLEKQMVGYEFEIDWKYDESSEVSKMLKNSQADENLLEANQNSIQPHIQEVALQLAKEIESNRIPIEDRLQLNRLHNLLVNEFAEKEINLPFEYAVVYIENDSVLPYKSENFDWADIGNSYHVSLFPNDIFNKSYSLYVTFSGMKTQIINSISLLLGGSSLFTLIIIVTFSISIFVIFRQKKISEIKSDFLNNMTHEFKTPIATISLAVDSISTPKILRDKSQVMYFTGIIKEENKRMNSLVESVLQMALIDKKSYSLNLQPENVHAIIEKVVENIRLQIEKKDGYICLDLRAKDSYANVDKIHFTNIIFNLLDNANKYSLNKPEIKICTANVEDFLVISVEDKGIGMNNETKNKLFEKFYRQTSGNLHNVKGYGLGLSYVHAIVAEHKGKISVKSEEGKGSRFDISIPACTKNETKS